MGLPLCGLTTCREGLKGQVHCTLRTWNITSLVEEEPELVHEAERHQLDIVGLISTAEEGVLPGLVSLLDSGSSRQVSTGQMGYSLGGL